MKSHFKYILIFLSFQAFGQFDSTDWGPKKWVPSQLRVGVNVYRLGESALSDLRSSYEIMAEIDFYKYFFVVEYGYESVSRGGGYDYSSEGTFFRMGIDQDLMSFNKNGNIISIGIRYARSTYSDQIDFAHSGLNGLQQVNFRNDNLTATWMEVDLGMRVHLTKNLMMGYQVRSKFFKAVKGEGVLETFDIPGFGRHKRNGREIRQNFVGFDYYLYWTIPFRNKYIPPKPED